MVSKKSSSKPINFGQLVETSKKECSENLKTIEHKLSGLNKLEIISRLSILTQTDIGRKSIENYYISDHPCLHFIIGLALKSESCGDTEPSKQDIDEILHSLKKYFPNFFFSEMMPIPGKKGKDDGVILHAQMHALIGQINPEKYPFQMRELLLETFGQLDDFFTKSYGFTITDAIEFSGKIIQNYQNSINLKKEIVQKKDLTRREKTAEFYSKMRELLEIVPEDFCKFNDCEITKFKNYLTAFSCSFGEGDPEYNSPLDENLFLKKPLLKINGRFYAPIPQDLFQKLPSIFEDFLEQEKRQKTKTWQKYQETKAKFTERKVTEYLGRIFEKDNIHENLFYSFEKGRTAEVDLIIPYRDNILIVESKSGNFSITAKKEGLTRITTVLTRLISDAHDQGIRTKEFIKNKNPAIFENSRGKKELELIYNQNETHFILINVTLEALLSFSSSLKNIESLGIFSNSEYPWSVNLFELDLITRYIDSPAIFIHYIMRRLNAQEENIFSTFDELSFLAFYLEQGNFSFHLEDGSKPVRIHLDPEFLEVFDQHYLYGGDPPKLKIEKEIKQIIDELEQLHPEGFINFTNAILDLNHENRITLIKSIEKVCSLTKKDNRVHNISFLTGNKKSGITIFSQNGKVKLFERMAFHSTIKKYQSKADSWIGFGIDVLDTTSMVHFYYFEDAKWTPDDRMDQIIRDGLKNGSLQSEFNCQL